METARKRTRRSEVSGAGLLVGLAVGFGGGAVAGGLWGADATDGSSRSPRETGRWR